jgi:hypothetical protein
MATQLTVRGRRTRRTCEIHKPNGTIHPRVQNVGPEHFGIVSFDCAKPRSKWMLANFYGQILIPPTLLRHLKRGLQVAIERIRAVLLSAVTLPLQSEHYYSCDTFQRITSFPFDVASIVPSGVKARASGTHSGRLKGPRRRPVATSQMYTSPMVVFCLKPKR